MEKILHDITMTWWQGALLKACMVSFGILLGVYFPKTLKKVQWIWWILFGVIAIYMLYIYWA